MTWLLPTRLPILAGVIGLALALPHVERPTSNSQMLAEVLAPGVLACAGSVAASG